MTQHSDIIRDALDKAGATDEAARRRVYDDLREKLAQSLNASGMAEEKVHAELTRFDRAALKAASGFDVPGVARTPFFQGRVCQGDGSRGRGRSDRLCRVSA